MIKKIIYITLGLVFLGIGAIGTFLPVLPTTPFLLVSAFCFARGSERLNNWFLSTQLYKNHLESFAKNKAMDLKTKTVILAFASTMLIIAFIFSDNLYARIVISIVFVLKYYYFIFRIKTIKRIKND